jgi:hypothetical protein
MDEGVAKGGGSIAAAARLQAHTLWAPDSAPRYAQPSASEGWQPMELAVHSVCGLCRADSVALQRCGGL